MLVDTHAHLYWESFQYDLDEVIQHSLDAGVTTIINVGVDVKLSKKALQQVQDKLANIPNLTTYSTIGIHPHEAIKYNSDTSLQQDIDKLEEIYQNSTEKVVAVGECGLDYLFESNPEWVPASLSTEQVKILQKKLFQAQINLAKKLNFPLLIHCRDDRSKNPSNSECWDEVLKMTKDWHGVYHCYSGLTHNTKYIIHNTDFLISFAANLTYPKNDYLREAAKNIPLDRICLETDSPFLSPQSKRGMRNEPASVKEIAELISELKGLSLREVALQTTYNVKKLFDL